MICPHYGKRTGKFNPTVYLRLWRERNPDKQKAIEKRQNEKRIMKRQRIKLFKLCQEFNILKKGATI